MNINRYISEILVSYTSYFITIEIVKRLIALCSMYMLSFFISDDSHLGVPAVSRPSVQQIWFGKLVTIISMSTVLLVLFVDVSLTLVINFSFGEIKPSFANKTILPEILDQC